MHGLHHTHSAIQEDAKSPEVQQSKEEEVDPESEGNTDNDECDLQKQHAQRKRTHTRAASYALTCVSAGGNFLHTKEKKHSAENSKQNMGESEWLKWIRKDEVTIGD